MPQLMGIANLIFGAVAWLVALTALIFLPDAWEQRINEPEDVNLLIFGFLLAVVAGAVSLRIGWHFTRRHAAARTTPRLSVTVSAVLAIVLAGIAALGLISKQPTSGELLFLILPSAFLAANYVVLRRPRMGAGDGQSDDRRGRG